MNWSFRRRPHYSLLEPLRRIWIQPEISRTPAAFSSLDLDVGKELNHKVLTYVEYRAVSGVFQNIDPHPPLHPASVYPPHQRRGITHSPAVRGMGGQYFGRRQTRVEPFGSSVIFLLIKCKNHYLGKEFSVSVRKKKNYKHGFCILILF
jgi:hypothetical protein